MRKTIALAVLALAAAGCQPQTWPPIGGHHGSQPPPAIEHPVICFQWPDGCDAPSCLDVPQPPELNCPEPGS